MYFYCSLAAAAPTDCELQWRCDA